MTRLGRARDRPAAPAGAEAPLVDRVEAYLRSQHTASIATVGRPGTDVAGMPHAATVFYASDARLRLTFLSKPTSRHGVDIGDGAPVAVTVAGIYQDWREIQGIQLWGEATRLSGAARAGAFAAYVARFPFVGAMLTDPSVAARLTQIAVYRVTPTRAAMTDNRRGLFGQEILDDLPGSP